MKKFLPILRNSPFFKGLTDDEILSILHCVNGTIISKERDSYIFRAGDSTEVMGLVVAGCVLVIQEDLWGHRNILSKCHAGDFFGEPYAASPGAVLNISVVADEDCEILFLNDSKKLSEKKRDLLFDEIKEKAVAYGIGIVSPQVIDEINILQATYEAMRQAISQLNVIPEILLNDAVTIPGVDIMQVPIVKGDAKSVSIAAASILAKVTRDRMMMEYDQIYPEYGFAKHKGYGTAAHIAALKEYGPCPIHRRTFIKKFVTV